MLNKKILTLIPGWLLIFYGINYYFSLKIENFNTLQGYTDVFRQRATLAGLLLFWSCICISLHQSLKPKGRENKLSLWASWLTGLILTLGITMGIFWYVNPHARFANDRFPYITPGARIIKTELYKKLDTAPDIVILGSSRAFTLSPEYLEKQTGYQAFNMSVEGARVGDNAIHLNYILAQAFLPDVLIVEVSQDSFSKKNYFATDLQPASLVPYLPLVPATTVIEEITKDAFSLQAMSDSAYLLNLPDRKNPFQTWRFDRTGLGIGLPTKLKRYRILLSKDISNRTKTLHCKTIENKTKQYFENTLELAAQNNMGVVVYESPINSILYENAYKASPHKFEHCRRIIHSYLRSLTSKYPNVFFRDLSRYKKVNNLRRNGFYDAIHLKPNAADKVIDALLPDVTSAMKWALGKQHQTSP